MAKMAEYLPWVTCLLMLAMGWYLNVSLKGDLNVKFDSVKAEVHALKVGSDFMQAEVHALKVGFDFMKAELTLEKGMEAASQTAVLIELNAGTCSGTRLQKGVILTAGHCIINEAKPSHNPTKQQAGKATIYTAEQEKTTFDVLGFYTAKGIDVGVVCLGNLSDDSLHLKNGSNPLVGEMWLGVDVSLDVPTIGRHVVGMKIGHPNPSHLVNGRVASKPIDDGKYILSTADNCIGMGMFTSTGKLFAVQTSLNLALVNVPQINDLLQHCDDLFAESNCAKPGHCPADS